MKIVEISGAARRHTDVMWNATLAGAAATLAMSAFEAIVTGGATGNPQESKAASEGGSESPTALAARAAHDAADTPQPDRRTARLEGHAVHAAFGIAAALGYAALPVPRAGLAQGAVLGAAYGAIVWALADEVALPLLGLDPRPQHRTSGNRFELFAAHLVYGSALGLTLTALEQREPRD